MTLSCCHPEVCIYRKNNYILQYIDVHIHLNFLYAHKIIVKQYLHAEKLSLNYPQEKIHKNEPQVKVIV